MHQTVIVIPVYNEEKVIRSVIYGVYKESFKHIIVVDDGSTDATLREVNKTGATLIRHSINRGKGAAIKTGMEAAKIIGYENIVTFDGDGQHNPKDIKTMIHYLYLGYDVVLGSRFLEDQPVPLVKRIANYGANILSQVLYGIWVTDSQSGLRAYSKPAYSLIDTRSDRYEFDSEVIREIAQKDLTYIEVPIDVRYTKYSQEKKNRQNVYSAISSVIRIILLS